MSAVICDRASGLDMVNPGRVKDLDPEKYMLTFLMGLASREDRMEMYKSMLDNGLKYRNDLMVHEGLSGVVNHFWKKRETKSESEEEVLEPIWTPEKDEEMFSQFGKVLNVLKSVASHPKMYCDVTPANASINDDFLWGVALPKTWTFLVGEVVSLVRKKKIFPTVIEPKPSAENEQAFCFLSELGTKDFFWKILERNVPGRFGHNTLSSKVREEVLDRLKNSVNLMTLPQVVFWLENHGKTMPIEFLNIFRIEFVRKGGSLDMDTTKKTM